MSIDMPQINIEYIGRKPSMTDRLAGTGTVWRRPGDVQPVARVAAALLLAHHDIFAEAIGADAAPSQAVAPAATAGDAAEAMAAAIVHAATLMQREQFEQTLFDLVNAAGLSKYFSDRSTANQAPAPPAEPGPLDIEGEGGKVFKLGDMDADQLRAFADAQGIKVDGRIKDADKLRAAVYAAATGQPE